MRPGPALEHRVADTRRTPHRFMGTALGVLLPSTWLVLAACVAPVAAAVLSLSLSTGPAYAEEQTFDDADSATLQVVSAATPEEAPEPPAPDESPADYLYAHYANAAQIDCLITAESRWRDVPNARGSGAAGYGQYLPATWQRYQAESERWDASPHDVYDVFAAIAWDLARGRRGQWAVGGC